MKVRLIGQKAMNLILKDMAGVKDAVHDEAQRISVRAKARLAPHRDTGRARVLVVRGEVDSYVVLDDEAAMSIEFGHFVKDENGNTGKYVRGLYILSGAAGLI